MAKKIIPVPSDFARPKPGAYIKKNEDASANNKKHKASNPYPKSKKQFEPKPEKKVFNSFSDLKKETPFSSSEFKNDKDRFEFAKKKAGKKPIQYKNKFGEVIEQAAPRAFIPKEKFNAFKNSEQTFDESKHAFYKSDAKFPKGKKNEATEISQEQMPLNKYIAHCGICSRRDAIELIRGGKVKVNDMLETQPGYKVQENDVVLLEGKKVIPQQKLVYYLLNKPKNYITSTEDPEGRKTVMDLMHGITEHRIFPVGRLDRNTTGLLLLTNDGELTQKLSHPKNNIKKVYQVGLDKPLNKKDFEAIAAGLTLEDGLAVVDEIAYTNPKDKTEIGIQIHSGRNRIVRRIFEHLHYEVKTLDRVVYAGLTKKNIQRGTYRELEPKEIIFLKHFK